MINSTDANILENYDIISQRIRDIENAIYWYIHLNIHPSKLLAGSHSAVLNFLLKGRKNTRVTPFVKFTLNYSQQDYENGTIERDLENYNLPIDINDAYRQVEERLTREHLNWNQVVIDIEWRYINGFKVDKKGVIINDSKQRSKHSI